MYLPGLLAGDIAYFYASQDRTWDELPPDVRGALEASYVSEGTYLDSCGNTSSMEGTALEPALWGAGAVGAGRLIWLMPQLGGGATSTLCADGDCTNEIVSLRKEYELAVRGLSQKADELRSLGKSAEEIARILHAERRALGIQYKNLTPPNLLEEIYLRNLLRYGDKYGPSIEWLLEHGKSWDDIIESATRSGGQDIIPKMLGK